MGIGRMTSRKGGHAGRWREAWSTPGRCPASSRVRQVRRGNDRKEKPARPQAEPGLARVRFGHADIDKPVEALAVDQRLEVAADQDVGAGLSGLRFALHPDWM